MVADPGPPQHVLAASTAGFRAVSRWWWWWCDVGEEPRHARLALQPEHAVRDLEPAADEPREPERHRLGFALDRNDDVVMATMQRGTRLLE